MIPTNLQKRKAFILFFILIASAHFSFGQCPQASNIIVTANPISCFNDANGSIKVVLNDSTAYKGVTVQFVLKQQIGGVFQTVSSRAKGLPYNTTFSNLAAATYQIEVNTRPTVVPSCGVVVLTTPNIFVPSPAGSFAGYEQYLCDSTYTIMGADDPAPVGAPPSTGKWTLVSGPSTPIFSDDTDPYSIVSNLITGAYTFRWTVSKSGCPDRSSDVTIRKRSTPVANAGSDTSVCAVPSVTLNGNNFGSLYIGEWSQVSGPNTSLIGDPSANSTSASGLVAGVYQFQWVLQDDLYACNPDTDVVIITNNVSPTTFTANVTPNPVCEGKSVAFGLSPVTATNTYTWSGPGGFTFTHTGAQALPTIANVAPSNAGSYSVVATTDLGCKSSSVSAGTLVVNPKPTKATITPSSNPVCQGNTLTLTASGALPVTWTLPDGSTSNTNPLGIANMQSTNAGKYKVSSTSGTCSSDADSVTIAVTTVTTPTIAQSGSGTYCSGAGFTLTANPLVVGATYTWTTPSGSTVTGRTLTIASASATDGGTYSVTITANGCTGSTATSNVNISSSPAQPSIITGASPVCQGDNNVGYSVASVAGVTYSWTYSGTGASITNSGASATLNFSATATSGSLNVTAIVSACSSAVRSLAITVNPKPSTPVPTSNSPVCAGQTINLSTAAVAGATYAWTGPNGFTSSSQSPTITSVTSANGGTYSVSVTVGGCTSTAGNVTVTVNPVFTPIASSNSPLCAGSALNLTASAVAGATYAWTGPNGFTSTSQNPSIAAATAAATGTYSVTATVAGCAGTAGTTSVTVNAQPAQPSAITGKTPVCPGESNVPYSVTSVAGVSYIWSYSGVGATITGTSNSVMVSYSATASSGNLSVSAVLGTCTSTVRTQAIVVNPIPTAPTVSSNSPVCAGSTLNLAASTIVGATYAWTGPNGFTSTSQNPSIANVTAAAAGTYSVAVTVGGCTSISATTNVSITALPIASASSNSPVCVGGTLNLTAATVAGATYAWTGPNSFSSTSQNPTIASATAAASGTYSLTVIQSGCTSLPSTTSVTINTTPAQPSAISGKNPVCAGESNVPYNVTSVAGISYVWTYSGTGAVITGSTNSVTVSYSSTATSGNLQVTAVLGACSSAVRTQAITVNPIPATPTASSNSPVCVGSAITLTTPTVAGATYAWTGPNGFSSALQNPTIASASVAAAGTYNVTVTTSSCTSLAGSTTVVVNTIPTSPTSSSNTPVCVGSALNLSATTVAGATYAWTGPNGFTSTLQNPSIASATAAAAGTYSVTATISGCTSVASTTTVVVTPLPTAPTASSNSPLCVASTLNLTASTVAGATYSWTGPNGFTSTLQNPSIASVTSANAGTYSVSLVASGCTSSVSTTTVVINAQPSAPTASSNSPVCVGSAISLTTPTVAGATYAWTGPNGFTSTLQNPTIASATAAAAGTYSVTVTSSNCTSLAGSTTVVINTIPTSPTASSNTPVCVGSALNLSATSVAGATYAWTGPNGFTSALQNPSIASATASAAGTYSVTATVSGCASIASTTTVVITPQPTTPTASSNSPLCVASTLNLTASTVAGATYSWTGPNGFSSTLQNPSIASVTVANAGTYSVSVVASGCSSNVSTTTVVINAQPSAPTASSNSPVCSGGTLNLSTPTVAGATYAWTGPNGFVSSLQNPSISGVTATATGTYSVTTSIGSCTSLPGSVAVSITSVPSSPTASSNSPICAGAALNLNATTVAGATYSWTGPNGFSSTLQNPSITSATVAATGTYSVTATVSGCSSVAATTAVTVNPLPTAPAASSNSPLCVTSTLTLTASTIAGATYAWTGPNGFTSALQNPSLASVTTANAGTYSVTAIVNGCTGTAGTTTVVVNTQPSAPTASSNSPVCAGGTVNLSTPTVAGATYNWTGPNGFTSTLQNPSISAVTAANAGTYNVTTTISNCTSLAGSTVVSITTLPTTPTASSNSPVCVGAAINLTSSTVAGATYAWTGPGGFTSSSQNPTIAASTSANAGTYSVVATVGSCSSLAGTTTVTVNPIPATPSASSNSPVCEGSTLGLSSSPVAGATYNWTGPNGFTSATQNPSISAVTVAAAGTYNVSATVAGCTSPIGSTTVSVIAIPAQPSAITGNSTVCQGATGVTYSVTNVPGLTYVWSYTGTGATITGSTNSISVDYSFTATAGNLTVTAVSGACSSAVRSLAITINPVPSAPTASSNTPICAGANLTLNATTVAGASYAWTGPNSFTASVQNPTINNATTAAAGTYSVTATVGGCTSAANTTTVVINNTPSQPGAISGSTSVCQTQSNVIYSVPNVPGVTHIWSYSGTGATIFVSGAITARLSFSATATSGILSVRAVAGACTSTVRNLSITVNPSPKQPVLSRSNSPLCVGEDLDLAVVPDPDPSISFSWTLPDNSTFIGTDFALPNISVADQGNYLVTAFSGGCLSPVLTIPVTVIPGFAPLPTSNSPICVGSNLTVSAAGVTSPGATYTWTGPNGFTNSNQSFTISNAQVTDSGTYTVVAHVGSCSSAPVSTHVKVNPIPATPSAITGSNGVCQGTSGTYSVTSVAGATYVWSYSGTGASFPSGNTGSSVSVAFATNATAGSLQVTAVASACSSAATVLPITVNPRPTTTASISSLSVCQGNDINLTSTTVAGATYAWTGPNGFTSTSQNPTISNAVAANGGAYLVTYSLNGCSGDTDTTNVTVNPTPNATFAYARTSYCQSEPVATPTSVPTGSSFLSSPSGLSLNSSTGAITFTSSTAGTYTITNTIVNASGCSDTASFTLSVLTAPTARTFTYPSPICNASTVAVLPSFTSTGNAGIFKSTSGLSIDASSGAIQPSASTSGTYLVTYLSTAGSCSDSTTSSVTISPSPSQPTLAGPSTICQGTSATLTATLTGFSSFTWYKDGSIVQPTGTSFSASSAGDYYVSTVATNGCTSPNSDTITLGISPKPAVPVINGACASSTPPVTLSTQYSSTAGYNYEWFRGTSSVGTNGTLVASTLGTYKTIVTEIATGCNSDTSVAIDPFGTGTAISIISGTNPFCSGDSVQLGSNSATGNTWTLAGSTIGSGATVLVKISGQLILTVVNGTCSGSDTLDILSNPTPTKPTIASASDSICAGDSLALTTSSSGSTQWLLSGVNISGATSSSVKVGQAGAYQVRVNNGTCSAVSDVKNIGVRPSPSKPLLDLTGAQQICQGASLTLTITNFTAGQDQWYLSNSPISAPSGTTSPLSATTAGIYKVIRTSSGGCQAVSDSVNLTVNPSVTATIKLSISDTAAKCANVAKRFVPQVTNVGTSPMYQWYVNDKLVATSSSPSARVIDTLTKTSEVKVVLISSNSCSASSQVADSVISKVADRFKVQTIVNPIGCASGSTGEIIFNVTNGSGDYVFNGPDLFNDTTVVTVAKTYQTLIFDEVTECSLDTAIVMNKATKFRMDATIKLATCNNSNGEITLSPVPVAGAYKVLAGPLTLGTTSNLTPGTYGISVRDTSTGCTIDSSYTLGGDGLFTTAITSTQPDCDKTNGTITITPTPGPTSSYTFFGPVLNQSVNNNLAPGVYTVTTSNGKCEVKDTIALGGKALFNIVATVVQPTCANPLGSIKIGTSPKIDFKVSGALKDSINNNLAAGVYPVTVTDNTTGCFKDSSFTLEKLIDVDPSFTVKAPVCFAKDGEITIALSPDTAIYQFTGNLAVGDNKNLDAGTYTFRALRVSTGCQFDTTINLTAPGRFTTAITTVQPDCGSLNGSITITPSPAGTYTYSGDLTQAVTTGLGPNTYIVTTTNSSSCSKKDTVELLGKPSFLILADVVQPSCSGNGSIKLSTSPKIDFTVSLDLKDSVNPNLVAGTYKIRITDKATLCAKDTTITLNKVVPFTVTSTTVNPTCRQSNGAVYFSVSPGPNSDYTFAGAGISSDTSRALVAGTYNVTITEKATGCQTTSTATLTSKADFTLTATMVKPFCNNSDGEIDLFITPSPNSQYTFDKQLKSDINKNLSSGNYEVLVTDKTTNCTLDTVLTLGNKTDFVVTAALTNPSCNKTDGSISLNVTPGPIANYTFGLDFASGPVLSNIGAGTYIARVTKTGSTTCFMDTSFTLQPVATFTVSAVLVHPSCNKADGSISLSPSGPNYTYTGLTQAVTTNLAAGTYPVEVTDGTTGCSVKDTFVLKNQVDFKVVASLTKPGCNQATGLIALQITPSPITDYTFGAPGVFTSDSLKNLTSGSYRAVITRAGSTCSMDTTFVLGNQTPFTVTATVVQPGCNKTDGSISLNVTPGPLSNYDFGGDFSGPVLTSLGDGDYHALITQKGASSCFKDTTFKLKSPASFTVTAVLTHPSCNKSDGVIALSPTGSNYSYNGTGGINQAVTSNLPAGKYGVEVKDLSTGCSVIDSFALKNQVDFTVKANMTKPSCNQSNGAIALELTPGSAADYTFSTPGVFTSAILNNIPTGDYRAVISRTGSTCSKDTIFKLGNQTPFDVTATMIDPTCGKADGKIFLKATIGSNSNYSFEDDFSSDSLVNASAGTYTAKVTDKNTSCVLVKSFTLKGQPDFAIAYTTVTPTCNKSDGAIFLSITPTPISDYTISGALSSDTTRSLPAGTYAFRVQRKNTTCIKDTSATLSIPTPKVDLGNGDTLCPDVAVTLKAKITDSLNITYSYVWMTGKDTLATAIKINTLEVHPKVSTVYKVYVSNGTGCPGLDSVKMTKPTRFKLDNTGYDFTDDSKIMLKFTVTDPAELNSDKIYVQRKTNDILSDWKSVDSIPKTNDKHPDRPETKGVYYYRLYYPGNNYCGEPLVSNSQRVVFLSATSDLEKLTAFLNWTTFSGWDNEVYEYQIYRSLENGEYTFYKSGNLDTLATYVNGNDGTKQCYKIKAVEKRTNGNESWSNTVCLNFDLGIGIFNVFTPNGDGHNDTFFFKNIQMFPNNELTVFNRWGNKVFHMVGYNNEWDGGDLPAGTYFYQLDLKDGKTKPIYGDVLLHR